MFDDEYDRTPLVTMPSSIRFTYAFNTYKHVCPFGKEQRKKKEKKGVFP